MARSKIFLSDGRDYVINQSLEEFNLDEKFIEVIFNDKTMLINISHIVCIQQLNEQPFAPQVLRF